MVVSRGDIEKALDEMIRGEDGLGFQRLAVVLAKQRWPDLIASEPKKDLGADARAVGSLAASGEGKVLACSLTAKLNKLQRDAAQIRHSFKDVKILIFATPRGVSTQAAEKWAKELNESFDYELAVLSREDIISSLQEPHNAVICRPMLHIAVDIEPDVSDLIEKAGRAAAVIRDEWFAQRRLAGQPLIDLRPVRLGDGEGRGEVLNSVTVLANFEVDAPL